MLLKSRLKFYQWPIILIRKTLPNLKRRSINNPQIIDSEYCHGIHFGPREKSQSGIDLLHHLLIANCAHGSSSATPGERWSKQIQLIIRVHLPISPWSFWIIQYPKNQRSSCSYYFISRCNVILLSCGQNFMSSSLSGVFLRFFVVV